MKEYDTLLEVRYGLCSDDPFQCLHRTFGTSRLSELKELISGKKLVVALDQASNKTGVCFMDFETRAVLAVLDLINYGFPSKQLYFESLHDFLSEHIADEDIAMFIYEIPVEHSKNHNTLAVLEALRIFIRGFNKRIPSLSSKNMIEVYNTTWKSQFLSAEKYAGRRQKRELVKEAVREEASCRVSGLKQYFYHIAEPPDSCDAVGIAYGTIAEIYGTNYDYRRPNKTMPIKNCKYSMRILPMQIDDIAAYVEQTFPFFHNTQRIEVLQFNTGMTPEENCKRYCSSNDGVLGIIPVFDAKTSKELKWETGKELSSGQVYVLFCWR